MLSWTEGDVCIFYETIYRPGFDKAKHLISNGNNQSFGDINAFYIYLVKNRVLD